MRSHTRTPRGYRFLLAVAQRARRKGFAGTVSRRKTLERTPSKATIHVYNFAPTSRAETDIRPLHVKLRGGYVDETPALIFEGDAYYTASRIDGPNWITTIQASDGHRANKYARVSQTFGMGTPVSAVLSTLLAKQGLTMPTSVASAREFLTMFPQGITLHGLASEETEKLAKRFGFTYSIQNGAAQFLRDSDVRLDEALVINQETGMLGSPATAVPTRKGKPPVMTARSWLRADMLPGIETKVESKTVNGLFKVLNVVHTGDLRGKAWFTEIEAVKL